MRRLLESLLAGLLVAGAPAQAQDAAPQAPPAPVEAVPVAERPGRFPVGPFWLTPSIRFGTLGYDSNVFYTPTEHQPDFSAEGGPALEVVLPRGDVSRFVVEGGVSYLYFARTETQRKLNGFVSGGFERTTERNQFSLLESYRRTNSRLGFEVDRRVAKRDEATDLGIRQPLFGRFTINLGGSRHRTRVDPGEQHLGTDLEKTLGLNGYRVSAGLEYAVTVKTALVAVSEYAWNRFPLEPARNGHTYKVGGGVQTDTTALIAGHAILGVRRFGLDTGGARRAIFADIDASGAFSPRTRLGVTYQRDLGYSAFDTSGPTPTLQREALGVNLTREITDRTDLRMFGGRTRYLSDGAITIVQPDGQVVIAVRDDTADQGGLNLGYRFGDKVRVGIDVRYVERRSSIQYFGIDGLIVGLTVDYDP